MEKWTELDERNLFVTKSNVMEAQTEAIIDKIRKISMGNIWLKNFAEIYKEKVFELEELFKMHGLSYFGQWSREVNVRLAIGNYLATEMLEMSEMLEVIANKLKGLYILYLNNITSKLANELIKRYVKQYQNKIKEFSSFSLDKNLKDILLEKFLDDRYYIHSEGDYINFYNEMHTLMNELGFSASFAEIAEEMKSYASKAEQAREKFAKEEMIAKSQSEAEPIDFAKYDEQTIKRIVELFDEDMVKDYSNYNQKESEGKHR